MKVPVSMIPTPTGGGFLVAAIVVAGLIGFAVLVTAKPHPPQQR